MISVAEATRILPCLPALARADRGLIDEIHREASLVRFPEGHAVFTEGDEPGGIALVLEGTVRVFKAGHSGREVTLYRFGRGEGCILTVTAVLTRQPFSARAVVEQAVEAAVIPAEVFRRWVRTHEVWQRFVFDLLARRLTAVLSLVDEVLFQRLDARVAALLADRSRTANPIHVTHQEIADELGSSREVISRVLEGFAEGGLVRVARGLVEVVDRQGIGARSVR